MYACGCEIWYHWSIRLACVWLYQNKLHTNAWWIYSYNNTYSFISFLPLIPKAEVVLLFSASARLSARLYVCPSVQNLRPWCIEKYFLNILETCLNHYLCKHLVQVPCGASWLIRFAHNWPKMIFCAFLWSFILSQGIDIPYSRSFY